ncbi:hypothetical protein COOONC_27829 [Cooperia oncophora]
MDSPKKKKGCKSAPSFPGSRWVVATVLLSVVILYVIYRPLPTGFTKKPLDRFYIHLFESALRVTYYWPSRIFPKASTMVWWTRSVLNALSPVLGPWWHDGSLIVETQTWDGVTVRVFSPRANASTDGAVFFIHGGGFALGNIDIYDSLTRRIARM